AVIAIVVLIVLIVVFAGKTKMFGKTTSDCPARGGECTDKAICPPGEMTHIGVNCPDKQKCCAPFDLVEEVKPASTEAAKPNKEPPKST
ncbi:hypothetical protein ACFL3V_07140, partial [Nanoarchaeota archaeon]